MIPRRELSRGEIGFRNRWIKYGIEKSLDVFRLDARNRFFAINQSFIRKIHGHHECGAGRALAGARLQHVELAVLDGEFHVLHVAIVLFKFHSNFFELAVDLGHALRHVGQRHRRANSGDYVFALRVDQKFAEEYFLAGGGIAREANARAGIFTAIAEDHLHHVDGGAEQAGDAFNAAVGDGLFGHP